MDEWLRYVAPLGVSVALYVAIRTEMVRLQGRTKDSQQAFSALKNEVELLKLRLNPLLTVMDKRLADMFHQDTDAEGLDAHIEKYRRDPDSLTDAELVELTAGIRAIYERAKRGSRREDFSEALAATLYLAMLDGRRHVRRRQRQEREQETTSVVDEPWWRRWWAILCGRTHP